MAAELLPLATYVLVTTFTPGPNNISATAAGVRMGLRKSFPYLLGIVTGFFVVILATGYFDYFLHSRYAGIAVVIKWVGFAYMLWLCVSLFLKHGGAKSVSYRFTYLEGALLQLVNPKVIFYGITLFGMFPKVLAADSLRILVSAFALSCVGLVSVITWCTVGAFLTRFLGSRRNELIFNAVLAGLLLYSAFSIILE